MKVFNAFFSVYRAVFYIAVILYLAVALGPFAVGIRPYVVLSASMEPTIMTGSLVYIQKPDAKVIFSNLVEYEEPKAGDIVAFNQGEGKNSITVVHRIQNIDSEGNYTMKGDNNQSDDIATIKKSQLVGRYKWDIPYLGYFTTWLQSKKGLIIAVILAAVAFISSFIGDAEEHKTAKPDQQNDEPKASAG